MKGAVSDTNAFRKFPLSPWMFLASLIFWMFMSYGGIKGLQYYGVHRSLDDSDLATNCPVKFKDTVEENSVVVDNITSGEATPYLKRIGSQKFSDSFAGDEAPADLTHIPPIVTAVASADFYNVQRLIEQTASLSTEKGIEIKLIIYDIGLYSKEKHLISTYCKCDVRTFEWSVYPDIVSDMEIKSWQPIIIQTMIEEFGSVFWIDPSASLRNIQDLKMLKYRGARNFFLWEHPVYTAINAYTNPLMFKYLDEKRCTFADTGMMDINSMVFYRTEVTWFSIMKPWLKCALNKDCIAPKGSRRTECFHYKRPKSTGCHWYQQSIFSILINRVFQFTFNVDKFKVPRLIRTEHTETVYFFPEQPWTYTEMLLVVTLPCMVVCVFLYILHRRSANKKRTFYNR